MSPFIRVLFSYATQLNPKKEFHASAWVSSQDFRDLMRVCICSQMSEKDTYLVFLESMIV